MEYTLVLGLRTRWWDPDVCASFGVRRAEARQPLPKHDFQKTGSLKLTTGRRFVRSDLASWLG